MQCRVCSEEDICGFGRTGCRGPTSCRWCNVAYDAKCTVCVKLFELRMKLSAIKAELDAVASEASRQKQPAGGCNSCARMAVQIDALCDKIKEGAMFVQVLRQRPIRKKADLDLLTGTPVGTPDDKHKMD